MGKVTNPVGPFDGTAQNKTVNLNVIAKTPEQQSAMKHLSALHSIRSDDYYAIYGRSVMKTFLEREERTKIDPSEKDKDDDKKDTGGKDDKKDTGRKDDKKDTGRKDDKDKRGRPTTVKIGILGGGIGGLYAAHMLRDLDKKFEEQNLDIKYEILEARNEVGGRLRTHKFPSKEGIADEHNYFDVGAMRFPKPHSERLNRLLEYLNKNLSTGKLTSIPFYLTDKKSNAFLYFNGRRAHVKDASKQDFRAEEVIQDVSDSTPYIKVGPQAIMDDAMSQFSRYLQLSNLQTTDPGWNYLQAFDKHSMRSYLTMRYMPSPHLGIPIAPLSNDLANWIQGAEEGFDRGLIDTVLDTLAYGHDHDSRKNQEWYCIEGGAQNIAFKLAKDLDRSNKAKELAGPSPKPGCTGEITFGARVTAIHSEGDKVKVEFRSKTEVSHRKYDHVISALPLPILRTLDLSDAGMSPMQSTALRQLNYGSSIKVGIRFKSQWWNSEDDEEKKNPNRLKTTDGKYLNIIGGQSFSDTPTCCVVYPSYGISGDKKCTVLIASYSWAEDARRMGCLIDSKHSDDLLKDLILHDLAHIHDVKFEDLKDQFVDLYAHDWGHDEYTGGSGAYFGPGKFGNLYTSMTTPAANGRLHFAGEALSVRHAWVEGALCSSARAVEEMLYFLPSSNELLMELRTAFSVDPEWFRGPNENWKPGKSTDYLFDRLKISHPTLDNEWMTSIQKPGEPTDYLSDRLKTSQPKSDDERTSQKPHPKLNNEYTPNMPNI